MALTQFFAKISVSLRRIIITALFSGLFLFGVGFFFGVGHWLVVEDAPEKAQAIRIVIAIAERMPELGRKFYERGPGKGIAKLAAYIKAQVEAGVLVVEDCEVAAAQLMEAYPAMLFKSMVFYFVSEPSPEQIGRVVPTAVKVFLAAYEAPKV